MAPDPAFAFVEGLCCPTHDFVSVFRTMITFNALLLRHFIPNDHLPLANCKWSMGLMANGHD